MARKGKDKAEAEVQLAHRARLEYLSRNHGFCQALKSLMDLRKALPEPGTSELSDERFDALQAFRLRLDETSKEWGVPFHLLSVLAWPKWREGAEPQEQIPAASSIMDSPVFVWTDTLPALEGSALGIALPERPPEDNRYLNLRVDLDHPVDALLPLIETELGRFSKAYRRGRRLLGKVEFYLKVFDLVKSGETFKGISRTLNRPLSTVKSAFLTAHRSVYGSADGPSKKALPMAGFDPAAHIAKCLTCKNAENFEQMCLRTQAFAGQDRPGRPRPRRPRPVS